VRLFWRDTRELFEWLQHGGTKITKDARRTDLDGLALAAALDAP